MTTQTHQNVVKSVFKVYSEAPAVFEELINLGDVTIYKGLGVINTCDQELTIKVGASDEIRVGAGGTTYDVLVLDNFRHNGAVSWKYSSIAPTTGTFMFYSF